VWRKARQEGLDGGPRKEIRLNVALGGDQGDRGRQAVPDAWSSDGKRCRSPTDLRDGGATSAAMNAERRRLLESVSDTGRIAILILQSTTEQCRASGDRRARRV